jgi:hypothetical protein
MEDEEGPLPDAVAAAWDDDLTPRSKRFTEREDRKRQSKPAGYVIASLAPSPMVHSGATSFADALVQSVTANREERENHKEGEPMRNFSIMTEEKYREAERTWAEREEQRSQRATQEFQGVIITDRYFYDDPLATAWMAKHFGVQFDCPSLAGIAIRAIIEDGNFIFDRLIGVELFRAYFHPDSLPILAPLEGDKDEDGYIYHSTVKWWLLEAKERIFNRGSDSHTAQRQGRPFFWPQKETV